ncbi:hypothetical protein [Embleya sp. NPDC005575]|uniref:hypothetical protein n=1 Tax=Embleya sp. NPDC005575 TaxID=3156892 RepID=UPI0033B3D3E3
MRPPTGTDGDEQLTADVEEFAVHDRKGGWALAYLVARRVRPDEGHGVGIEQESTKRFDRNVFRRVSAREFAHRAGTGTKRILAFYDAWNRAAADKHVEPAHELSPGVHVELPDEDKVPFFGKHGYYRSYEARMNAGERRSSIEQEAERAGVKPAASIYMAQHPGALKTAVLADPGTRVAAREAIEEYDRREAERERADRDAARSVTAEREKEHDLARDDDEEAAAEKAAVAQAVRSASRAKSPTDAALEVFTELTAVRLGTLRALTLLQQHTITFSDERSAAIADLCNGAQAAISFIRDLAASHHGALGDAALRAFLDESEKLG